MGINCYMIPVSCSVSVLLSSTFLRRTRFSPSLCQHGRLQVSSACLSIFFSFNNFIFHLEGVHGTEPFACDHPGCTFRTTRHASITDHKRQVHRDERPFPCQHMGCSFRGKTNTSLTAHANEHQSTERRDHMSSQHQKKDHDMDNMLVTDVPSDRQEEAASQDQVIDHHNSEAEAASPTDSNCMISGQTDRSFSAASIADQDSRPDDAMDTNDAEFLPAAQELKQGSAYMEELADAAAPLKLDSAEQSDVPSDRQEEEASQDQGSQQVWKVSGSGDACPHREQVCDWTL